MGSDLRARQPSWLDGFMASPSWFPLQKGHHSRFHLLGHEAAAATGGHRGRRWQNLLRRLMKRGSGVHGPKPPLTFHYDIASYCKNFDDGFSWAREPRPPTAGGAATVSQHVNLKVI